MKRVILMASLTLFPRLLVAQELDLASLAGEDWYGLYLNGKKVGYSMASVALEDDGTVAVVDDACFRLSMMGVSQDMRMFAKRFYGEDGALLHIEQQVDDQLGTKRFDASVEGDELVLRTIVGGETKEQRLPKPKESLKDVLKTAQLVSGAAKVGDGISYSIFEPMYGKDILGTSAIAAIEERVLDGAPTKVFKVESNFATLGIQSVSYVAEDGTTLEDHLAGIITMRLEPKEIAQDVNYSNDVIVSNAARVDSPILNPRERASLRLRLAGPLAQEHLFTDGRQSLKAADDHIEFKAVRQCLDGFEAARLPVAEAAVEEWLKATVLVQSGDAELVDKAKEIVGEEKDTFAISTKLCCWVNAHVRTTFSAQLTNSLEVLHNLEGDCTEHSILFIGLARAAGVPAREAAGVVYVEGNDPGFYFHQWASVWVGKWIDVDPTFNQPLVDVTHIKLAQGDLFEQTRLVPIIGRLQIEVLEDDEHD